MIVPSDILPFAYVDGAFVSSRHACVSAFDRGFLVADGIFETCHVVSGVPLGLDAHLERLVASARFMRLPPEPGPHGLRPAIMGLIERNRQACGDDEAALRLTITRGLSLDGPCTVTAFMRRLSAGHLSKRTVGVRMWVLPFGRHASGDLAQHKTLSYLASSLGQVFLRDHTADARAEGLFVSESGDVLEGTASNVFIVEGDRVVTPPVAHGLLPGTSRRVVLEIAPEAGLSVLESPIRLTRLECADEVFITSSTLRVAPVVEFEGRPVGGGRPGATVRRLQAAFETRVEREIAEFERGLVY